MKWLDDKISRWAESIAIKRVTKQQRDIGVKMSTASQAQWAGISLNSLSGQKGGSTLNRADFNRDKSMNFTLHPATGGWILELSHYEPNTDRYTQRLHIINDGDDMGDAISKILTLELLRK